MKSSCSWKRQWVPFQFRKRILLSVPKEIIILPTKVCISVHKSGRIHVGTTTNKARKAIRQGATSEGSCWLIKSDWEGKRWKFQTFDVQKGPLVFTPPYGCEKSVKQGIFSVVSVPWSTPLSTSLNAAAWAAIIKAFVTNIAYEVAASPLAMRMSLVAYLEFHGSA
ncbi:hypothetical protein BC938DRAFT_482459 [Jimgerdemannia flammicorona]|uniref:Uncharacterized protein n=1 Tax=Jimgerdemannia flammicorona TaxID=994334 RepID=A0A433QDZ9_9FUNG|nr:hypothetical protein BC938DRAFT_482459 [Jimgerdemannia flammicorona]